MLDRFLSSLILGLISGGLITPLTSETRVLNLSLLTQSPTPTSPSPVQFQDVTGDLYATEIEQAVSRGIVAGFKDGTFRPQASLTREQLLSILVNAMPSVLLQHPSLGTKPTLPSVPTQVTTNPFPDVDKTRWSAPKIQYLKSLGIIRGYPDGTFRPSQTVTRAELMVILGAIDRYLVEFRGNWNGRLWFPLPDPLPFSDVDRHWAKDTILGMSSNCLPDQRVATFLNETGTRFAPDTVAQRNYAVAATLRAVACLNILPRPRS